MLNQFLFLTLCRVWTKPPPVPTRFRMLWYEMVMSCLPPHFHEDWVERQPRFHGLGIIPNAEFKLANRCVAIVTQLQQFPLVDTFVKAQSNMKFYLQRARMLATQYPVLIGLLVMEKELQQVYTTYDTYLQKKNEVLSMIGDTLKNNPFPMADRYRRRCVAMVQIAIIKAIGNIVTRGLLANGDLSPTVLKKEKIFQSSYFLITLWNNIGRVAYEIDSDLDLDQWGTSLLPNTSNLLRDG